MRRRRKRRKERKMKKWTTEKETQRSCEKSNPLPRAYYSDNLLLFLGRPCRGRLCIAAECRGVLRVSCGTALPVFRKKANRYDFSPFLYLLYFSLFLSFFICFSLFFPISVFPGNQRMEYRDCLTPRLDVEHGMISSR